MQTADIKSVSSDQAEWENQLLAYKKELAELNKQLTEFASSHGNREESALIEHFHNQFVIQNENIDILKHDLHQYTKSLLKSTDESLTDEQNETHQQFKDQFESESKVYQELKTEFNNFVKSLN